MYRSIYQRMAEDNGANTRLSERLALERSIALLELAKLGSPDSREMIDALYCVNQLWTAFLEDLAHADNGLPDTLKASLISIGIWVLRRVEEVRLGKATDLSALIEVSRSIAGGLTRG